MKRKWIGRFCNFKLEFTVIQDSLKNGQNYFTVPGAQELSELASGRVSAAERASEASSEEQANEGAVSSDRVSGASDRVSGRRDRASG